MLSLPLSRTGRLVNHYSTIVRGSSCRRLNIASSLSSYNTTSKENPEIVEVLDGPLSSVFVRSQRRSLPSLATTTRTSLCVTEKNYKMGHWLNVRTFSDQTTEEKANGSSKEENTDENEENGAEKTEKEEEKEEEKDEEISREEQLEKELKEMKDQLLRSLAEQENTRRIAQRDVASAKNFAIKSFAKSLLEVSDNLSRALDAVPEELRKDNEKNPVLVTLYEGIKMTEVGLTKSFESNGLVRYGKPGDTFDPNKHDALFEYPDAEKEPGTIGQVMKVGYFLNDRVLRPAEVGVIKKA